MNGAAIDSVLKLPAHVLRDLSFWARAGYPNETCGLLVGRNGAGDAGQARQVMAARLARNLDTRRARDRYEVDPIELVAADRAASAAGLEIIGVWHTHPDQPARPSETDRETAWSGWSYLILSVGTGGVTDARAWRLEGGQFSEQVIQP